MLSVFDRINKALTDYVMLSKKDLFEIANIPNTLSNRLMFKILVNNEKLIPLGHGRGTKYHLPPMSKCMPIEGNYIFKQNGDGNIIFEFELEEPITFPSYEECVVFIKRRLTNG
jgi:hypothetical protein